MPACSQLFNAYDSADRDYRIFFCLVFGLLSEQFFKLSCLVQSSNIIFLIFVYLLIVLLVAFNLCRLNFLSSLVLGIIFYQAVLSIGLAAFVPLVLLSLYGYILNPRELYITFRGFVFIIINTISIYLYLNKLDKFVEALLLVKGNFNLEYINLVFIFFIAVNVFIISSYLKTKKLRKILTFLTYIPHWIIISIVSAKKVSLINTNNLKIAFKGLYNPIINHLEGLKIKANPELVEALKLVDSEFILASTKKAVNGRIISILNMHTELSFPAPELSKIERFFGWICDNPFKSLAILIVLLVLGYAFYVSISSPPSNGSGSVNPEPTKTNPETPKDIPESKPTPEENTKLEEIIPEIKQQSLKRIPDDVLEDVVRNTKEAAKAGVSTLIENLKFLRFEKVDTFIIFIPRVLELAPVVFAAIPFFLESPEIYRLFPEINVNFLRAIHYFTEIQNDPNIDPAFIEHLRNWEALLSQVYDYRSKVEGLTLAEQKEKFCGDREFKGLAKLCYREMMYFHDLANKAHSPLEVNGYKLGKNHLEIYSQVMAKTYNYISDVTRGRR